MAASCRSPLGLPRSIFSAAIQTAFRPYSFRPSSDCAAIRVHGCSCTSCAAPWSTRIVCRWLNWLKDEGEIPYRTKDDPPAGGQGRSHVGKLLIIGAVELSAEHRPGRIRLDRLQDFSAASIAGFIGGAVAPGATIVSDGLQAYRSLKQHKHQRKVVGSMAAHIVLPWIHRVFANLKRWGLGTFHGMRQAHLRRYLDEFVFRWNRRRHTRAAFDTLVGLTTRLGHASYRDFVDQRI